MNNSDRIEKERKGVWLTAQESQRGRFWIVALLSALLLFPALRGKGLAGYDDAFFAHEAKEMVRTGDWWNVRLNGEIIFEIPPMFVWMQAASFRLFGVNDAAAKFPAVVLGFSTILLVYFLTLELTGQPWLSLCAMLVLASTQFFLKNATHAMTDVPFTFFFTLAIFFFQKGLKSRAYLTLLGIPVGLALLTRSVLGLLPLAVILCQLIWTRRYSVLWSPWLISGVLLAFALSSIWYLSQYRQHGPEYFVAHFQFLNSKLHVKSGVGGWTTILNYPIALLKYYWPWLPFLVAGLILEAQVAIRSRDQTAILLIVWVLVIMVPFTLAETRYPRYIMSVFPAFSVLAAIALDRSIPARRRCIFFNAACGIGCMAVLLFFVFPPKARADDILKLAPIAEANSSPDQRVLIYTYENGRQDYLYQFIWYSDRYAELAASVDDLAMALRSRESATVIMDKPSYSVLMPMVPGRNPRVLGESEHLVCFRLP